MVYPPLLAREQLLVDVVEPPHAECSFGLR